MADMRERPISSQPSRGVRGRSRDGHVACVVEVDQATRRLLEGGLLYHLRPLAREQRVLDEFWEFRLGDRGLELVCSRPVRVTEDWQMEMCEEVYMELAQAASRRQEMTEAWRGEKQLWGCDMLCDPGLFAPTSAFQSKLDRRGADPDPPELGSARDRAGGPRPGPPDEGFGRSGTPGSPQHAAVHGSRVTHASHF